MSVSQLHMSALVDEETNNLGVAVLHCHHQRSTAEAVDAVKVAAAQVAQHGLDALQVAVGSWEWGCKVFVKTILQFLCYCCYCTTCVSQYGTTQKPRTTESADLPSPLLPSLTSSMQWCPLHGGIVHQGAGPAVQEDGNNVPVREKVEECGREEGVTVTEGLFVHTTSLSISSYWQLVSEAGINYHHAPTHSEHILQLTCDLGRQPSPMVFGPLGPCDQSGSGSGRAARPQPQCGHCRPRRREGDSPIIPCYHLCINQIFPHSLQDGEESFEGNPDSQIHTPLGAGP